MKTEDNKEATTESLYGSLLLILALPVHLILVGVVTKMYWHWFVVEHFEFKEMTFPVACGIGMFLLWARHEQPDVENRKDLTHRLKQASAEILSTIIALVFGFIVSLFV